MPEAKKKPKLPHHRLNARVRELLEADEDSLDRGKRALVYFLKLVRETWREVQEKNCTLRATALAYKSLISLVPVAAVVMAVLSSPALQSRRDQVIDQMLNYIIPVESGATVSARGGAPAGPTGGEGAAPAPAPAPAAGSDPTSGAGQESAAGADGAASEGGSAGAKGRVRIQAMIKGEISKLAKRAAAVGTISFVVLLLVVLSLMYTVEETFNIIWGVKHGRALMSRVVSYTAALFWGPVLVAASLSLSATGQFSSFMQHLDGLRPVIAFVMPTLILAGTFMAMYVVLPNTRVRWKPALAGAALGAVLWQLATVGFNLYVKYVVVKNPVYGALGLIPMVFLWLYVTWVVVLFGASVTFTIQNYEDLTRKHERRRRGVRFRVYYAIRTAAAVAARFARGESTLVVDELSERLDIPEYAVRESLDALAGRGLLVPVTGELDTYLPARPLEKITVANILDAVSGDTFRLPAVSADQTHRRIENLLDGADQELRARLGGVSLRDLVDDEQASRSQWLEEHGGSPA